MNKLATAFLGALALMGANFPARSAESMALKDASAVFNQWIAAYQAKDAERIMSIFDKTLIYSSQGEADQNYAELKKGYQEFFATKPTPSKWKAIPKEVHAQAGLAVVVSIWEQRQKDTSGHEELVARLRSIDIFRPTKAGWKIVRTINYSEPN
jgi:ketosteroid isomerase-like protein